MVKDTSDNIYQFELPINSHVKYPFVLNIFYDFEQNVPVNMKFIKFQNKITTQSDLACDKRRHQKGAWVQSRVRFYINRIPEGVRPFSMYLWTCKKCGLPARVQFLCYDVDPETLPKVGEMQKMLKPNTIFEKFFGKKKKLRSTIPSGVRRVTIEGK